MQVRFGPASAPVLSNAIRAAAARRTVFDVGDKAWICDVASELRIPVESLAQELIRLLQAGEIAMGRIDLVQLVPPELLEASRVVTADGRVEFHFIRVSR